MRWSRRSIGKTPIKSKSHGGSVSTARVVAMSMPSRTAQYSTKSLGVDVRSAPRLASPALYVPGASRPRYDGGRLVVAPEGSEGLTISRAGRVRFHRPEPAMAALRSRYGGRRTSSLCSLECYPNSSVCGELG